MSFVTRCPACATHFRVVSDQLKISDGWVRCGQCGEVFDASVQLAALPPAQPDTLVAPPSASQASDDARLEPTVAGPVVSEPEWTPYPEPEPDFTPPTEKIQEPASDRISPQDDGPDSLYDLPPATELVPASPQPSDELLAGQEAMNAFPEQVGFVREAQRRGWWQRPAVRWGLGLLSLLLCLGLLLQWVIFERDRIAALRPDLRPALSLLCQPLGCQVEPPRWVQALSIDSTTLARRGNGRYALEVVLRNASVFELAMPALELSLTDVRDQLLLRRVILPADLPAAPATVPANNTLTLRVDVLLDGPAGEALAGYRTLVFYP